jgi:hypothetical protein
VKALEIRRKGWTPIRATRVLSLRRIVEALAHFLASLEVRHVLLIDSDGGASLRIAAVPRGAGIAVLGAPTSYKAAKSLEYRPD